MKDKYLPPMEDRKRTIVEQIAEAQRIIYRNQVENLEFVKNNERNKQEEVEINNKRLAEKLDLLFEEYERLETSSNLSK